MSAKTAVPEKNSETKAPITPKGVERETLSDRINRVHNAIARRAKHRTVGVADRVFAERRLAQTTVPASLACRRRRFRLSRGLEYRAVVPRNLIFYTPGLACPLPPALVNSG